MVNKFLIDFVEFLKKVPRLGKLMIFLKSLKVKMTKYFKLRYLLNIICNQLS